MRTLLAGFTGGRWYPCTTWAQKTDCDMRESDLYPRIRAEFEGVTVRIDTPSRPGISDLVLVGRVLTLFTEVKIASTAIEKLEVSAPQHRFIQQVDAAGGVGCVLAYVRGEQGWYVILPKVLDLWWPQIRAKHGISLGPRIDLMETRIASIRRKSGVPFASASKSEITMPAQDAASTLRRQVQHE